MTEMPVETREALEASIAHWEANVRAEDFLHIKIYNDDCPLCTLFYNKFCSGCPVRGKTGMIFCQESPWADEVYLNYERLKGAKDDEFSEALAQFHLAAQEEVDFLKSLQPCWPDCGKFNSPGLERGGCDHEKA